MKVNYSEIVSCKASAELNQKIDDILDSCTPDDPPYLSDALVNIDQGGHHLMVELGYRTKELEVNMPDEQRMKWHIQVLRDEWGNPPKPGDKIRRMKNKSFKDRDGNPIGGHEISRAIADGTYKDRFEMEYFYEVDERGCIECGFEDAVYYLNLWGIHGKSGASLTTKPLKSTEPVKAPNGQMLHVWYRRYKELDKDEYYALAPLETSKTPKRGYSK